MRGTPILIGKGRRAPRAVGIAPHAPRFVARDFHGVLFIRQSATHIKGEPALPVQVRGCAGKFLPLDIVDLLFRVAGDIDGDDVFTRDEQRLEIEHRDTPVAKTVALDRLRLLVVHPHGKTLARDDRRISLRGCFREGELFAEDHLVSVARGQHMVRAEFDWRTRRGRSGDLLLHGIHRGGRLRDGHTRLLDDRRIILQRRVLRGLLRLDEFFLRGVELRLEAAERRALRAEIDWLARPNPLRHPQTVRAKIKLQRGGQPRPLAAQRAERIAELLRREPPRERAAKDKPLLFPRPFNCWKLIRTRCANRPDGVFQVVTVRHEILRQPVEQVAIPRRLVHVVQRLDQPATKQPRPQPVHDGPREPPVLRAGNNLREPLQPLRFRRIPVERADLGIQKPARRFLAGGLVAMHQLQRLVRIDRRESVGIG